MFLRLSSLFPPLSHGNKKLFLAGSHLLDQGLVAGLFMARRPDRHFRKHGRQVNPFGRKRVNHFSSIGGVSFRLDNSVGLQPAETVGQNIGGDFFVGVQEFVKGLVSTRHHAGRLHFQRRNKGLTYSYIGMYCGCHGKGSYNL